MSLVTTVTLASRDGSLGESEVRVRTLQELFKVCHDAPAHRVVRISLRGSEGEVRLNFASFIHKG